MDERVVKFRVGVMVLATLFITGILVLLFGDTRSLVRGTYTIYMHFSDAPGVTDGTPVRKSGILVGRVTSVRFADQGGVIVEAKIDGKVKIYKNEVPQVSGSILGGDVVIQFVRKDAAAALARGPDFVAAAAPEDGKAELNPGPAKKSDAADQILHNGDYIEGTVAPNPFQVMTNLQGNLDKAVGSLSSASDQVGKLAGSFNKMITNNEDQISRIINKTEQTLDSFQKALANVDDLLGNDALRDSLKKTITNLPELLTDTRSAMNTVRTTVESVDRNLRNLEGLTGPLGERGEQLVNNVDTAVARLDQLLGDLSEFGKRLNRGEGSFGQLMRNPELYQRLNAAAKNIQEITEQVKPIIADARVFSDKIARHPEVLGVRGAIQKSPGTK